MYHISVHLVCDHIIAFHSIQLGLLHWIKDLIIFLKALNNICEEIVSKPKPRVESPMDDDIQPEPQHNKKSPEDVTMEYTDFVQNDAEHKHIE